MKHSENSKQSTTKQRDPVRSCPSRRTVLCFAGVFGLATPVAMVGAARALTAMKSGPLPEELPICRAVTTGEQLTGPPRTLTLAWNATSVCTAAAPVAKERGVFAKHNLDVDFINFGGSTEQLLEAIATGKADAGIGMALRWLKPLEQGFDVRITAGVHGGCIRLLGSKAAAHHQSGIAARQDHRHQRPGKPSEEFLLHRARQRTGSIRSGTSTGDNTRPICSRLQWRRARPRR